MLAITDPAGERNCRGLSRRELLRIGALGFGGLGLNDLMALRASAALAGASLKDKSVVLLFLQGGPTHIEFFDPKMTAPAEIRSMTGEVKTRLPGITFGGTFPQLAEMHGPDCGRAVLRLQEQRAQRHRRRHRGGNSLKASASSLYARLAGNNHPQTGMPRSVLVLPEAVSPELKLEGNFETRRDSHADAARRAGAAFAAFDPAGGRQPAEEHAAELARRAL